MRESLNNLKLRLKAVFTRRQLDRDLDDELAFHLAMRQEKYASELGLSKDESRLAAKRKFGNDAIIKEGIREMWSFISIETLLQDVRYGARMLRKNPGFTVVAVLTLALGIGANSAIFSVVNAVLLHTIPFKDPGRLVSITEMEPFLADAPVSPADFCDWSVQNDVFEKTSLLNEGRFSFTGQGSPEQLPGATVSTNFFQMLGVEPVLGRDFSGAEDNAGNQSVALISYSLWQRRFSGDKSVLGKSMVLDGKSYSIIGVTPTLKFDHPDPEVWFPVSCQTKGILESRGTHYAAVWARLKPGVTVQRAQSEMDAIAKGLENKYPDSNSGLGVHVVPLAQSQTADLRAGLLLLLSAVLFVLLIACANVANLQLARSSSRQHELAVRAAVGASRARLIHQLLTEGLLLSLTGGLLGLALAYVAVPLLARRLPEYVVAIWSIKVDGSVVLFTFLISVGTAIIFGLVPAFKSSRPDLNDALGSSRRFSPAGHNRIRNFLVVAETAIALLLLVSAGLMLRSFLMLSADNPGFNPEGALTFRIDLPDYKYPGEKQPLFFKQAVEKIRALPGVIAAAGTQNLPGQNGNSSGVEIVGQPSLPSGHKPLVGTMVVTNGYFRTASVPIIQGRDFQETDDLKNPLVVIIDRRFAEHYFKGLNPIGQQVRLYGKDMQIIGIAENVKEHGFNANMPELYLSESQAPSSGMAIIARTSVDPESLAKSMEDAVHSIDSDQPVYAFRTLHAVFDENLMPVRLNTTLLVAFGLLALLLAAVGTYGVVSYSTSQRNHEIGIRLAMGATPSDVLRLIVFQGGRIALLGVGLGVAGSLLVTRWMSSLLFGIRPTDLPTFAVAAVALSLVGLLACYLPARRAISGDPLSALRSE